MITETSLGPLNLQTVMYRACDLMRQRGTAELLEFLVYPTRNQRDVKVAAKFVKAMKQALHDLASEHLLNAQLEAESQAHGQFKVLSAEAPVEAPPVKRSHKSKGIRTQRPRTKKAQ